MAGSESGIIRIRRWIDSETAEDDFYDVPADKYEIIVDLIRQGNKSEALFIVMQSGQKIDAPPMIEIDGF